ncbi:adenylate/guanylate cyclase domain-containing protein [Oligoflexus tunisiensis]|uniref:adenylate/guanylate cyclase domain-containing protein n=1 Tax=Oligoflexus tunisiensis TaxID=708132 RepID=UPI000ADF879E|nr:adenylate/guanylate cyclase domain-containing protein [Oligoflexus tunisiensis]
MDRIQTLILALFLALAWTAPVRAESSSQWMEQATFVERQLLDDPQAAYDQAVTLRASVSRKEQAALWIRASTAMIIGLSYLGRYEEIEAILDEAMEAAKTHQVKDLEAMLLIQKSRTLEYRGQSQDALNLLQSLEPKVETLALPRFTASLYNNLANFSLKYGNESQAALYVQKAFDALKNHPHDHTYYAILNNIGSAYMKLSVEDQGRAISIFEEVKRYALDAKLRFLGNLAAYNLGLCFADARRWSEALAAYQDSLRFAVDMNDTQSIAYGHFGIGLSLNGLERYREALTELLKSLDIFEAQTNNFAAFEARLELLKAHVQLNQFREAEQILELLRKDPLLEDALVPLQAITEYEALLRMRMGRFEEAAKTYQRLMGVMSQLEKTRNVELAKKYNAQFELERRTQANERLQQENRIQAMELEGNRKYNAILFVCIGLIGFISLIIAMHSIRMGRKNRRIEELQSYIENNILQRFLPPVMVQEVLEGRSRLEESAKMETVTVLFADLCDFTLATDQLGAQAVSHILNDFFLHMTDIVMEEGGTVDKFIGDAVMVIFGVPDPMTAEDQARKAARCAQAMQACLQTLNKRWQTNHEGHNFAMRIGIHQGPAVIGSFGGRRRSDYTVVGNSVNIASRIEAMAEANEIILSRVIAEQLPEGRCRYLGEFQIRGIRDLMTLYALDPSPVESETLPLGA